MTKAALPFALPKAFVALAKAGRFDYWGAPYRSLTDAKRQALIPKRMPKVLWWKPIEWDRKLQEIGRDGEDTPWRPGLVPFAGNGCGDQYCWYPRWQEPGAAEPPIVFFVHDELESALFARTFAECLCRCMLQSYAIWDEAEDGDAKLMRTLFRAHLAIVKPFLTVPQRKLLSGLATKLSTAACEATEAKLAREIGNRKMLGALQPAKYAEEYWDDKKLLLAAYERSVRFYEELVNDERRPEFQPKLDEARANRARVAAKLGEKRRRTSKP